MPVCIAACCSFEMCCVTIEDILCNILCGRLLPFQRFGDRHRNLVHLLDNGANILDLGHRIPPCALNLMNARINMIARDRRHSGKCLHLRRDIGEAAAGVASARCLDSISFVISSQ
jgi:hypothetical protein